MSHSTGQRWCHDDGTEDDDTEDDESAEQHRKTEVDTLPVKRCLTDTSPHLGSTGPSTDAISHLARSSLPSPASAPKSLPMSPVTKGYPYGTPQRVSDLREVETSPLGPDDCVSAAMSKSPEESACEEGVKTAKSEAGFAPPAAHPPKGLGVDVGVHEYPTSFQSPPLPPPSGSLLHPNGAGMPSLPLPTRPAPRAFNTAPPDNCSHDLDSLPRTSSSREDRTLPEPHAQEHASLLQRIRRTLSFRP
jgi:hypothetical protein